MQGSELDEIGAKRWNSASHHGVRHIEALPQSGAGEYTLPDLSRLATGALDGRGASSLRASSLLGMQRTYGNRSVQRYLQSSVDDDLTRVSRFEWGAALDTLDTVSKASEWVNPTNLFMMPSRAAQRIGNFATQHMEQNPDAGIMDIISGTFDAERAHERKSAASVRAAEKSFGRGVERVEGAISGGADWLADQVEGIPGLGDSARRGATTVSDYAQIGTGVVKGAGTLVGGLAQMVVNPIDTIAGLGALAEHVPTMSMIGIPNPLKMAHAGYDVIANDRPWQNAYDSVFNPVASQREDTEFFMKMGKGLLEPYAEAAGRGRFGEVVGRGAFDIGSLFIGAGEARGAAEVGQAARVLEGAEAATTAVRAVEGAEAASAAVRGMEGAEAALIAAQGADAVRVAEGIEGARGAAAVKTAMVRNKTAPPVGQVPAPVELPPLEATKSPVPDINAFGMDEITEVTNRGEAAGMGSAVAGEVPQPVRMSGPQPVELPPTGPTAPAEATALDEVTDVIRRDALDTIPDAPAKEIPAPVELPPAPSKPTSILDKALDAFKKLMGGDIKLKDAPETIKLPEELTKGMDEAMGKSFPGGKSQEQGGILVENLKDGSFEWKEGPPGTSGTFEVNYKDVGPDQKLVSSGHTHPYDVSEGSHTNVGPSSGDVFDLVKAPEPTAMVQSGEGQFMSVKTEEFNQRVQGLDAAGKQALQAEINRRWGEVYNDALKTMSMEDAARTANQIIHSEFDLLYYEGKGGTLNRG
jgi:hypothetical protein